MSEEKPTYKVAHRSESKEQKAFVAEVLYRYSSRADFYRPLFFATANGAWLGGNQFALMTKYKAEGFTPGVSDILYLQPRGVWSYLAIEMKAAHVKNNQGGGVSEAQDTFLHAVLAAGGLAVVAYGAQEAIEAFDLYMGAG